VTEGRQEGLVRVHTGAGVILLSPRSLKSIIFKGLVFPSSRFSERIAEAVLTYIDFLSLR
jgi:hypothetical protein